jgi:hypothetical protein
MDRNQQVLAIAFKKAKRKLQRIKELGITADMSEDAIDSLVTQLAEAKAVEAEAPVKDFLDGQQWYVESLVTASGMTSQELIDAEYEDSFADAASEDEMSEVLDALRAA